MFTKTGKLLVTNIKNSVLYQFVVGLIGSLVELGEQNGSMGEYIEAAQEAVKDFEAAFNKNSKHPFTAKIEEKHKERISFYIALKHQITVAMKMVHTPSMVAAAGKLKKEQKECDLWVYKTLSYHAASNVIRQILNKFAVEPFSNWAMDASLPALVESLRMAQFEFESLRQDRIEDISSDLTPVESKARKDLIEVALSTLDAIDFGVRRNKKVLVNLANDISEMITETNSLTRASVTRAENGKEEANEDTEAEGVTEIEPEAEEGPEADAVSEEAA